ncbi:MAG: hypothetical protein AAF654_06300 [Myxococcota bacterium]
MRGCAGFIACVAVVFTGCGAGVPITVRVDEFTFDFDLDEVADLLGDELTGSGALPIGLDELPEIWPASLPTIDYRTTFATSPLVLDLNPEPDDPDFQKYEDINRYSDAIRRVEVNELVVRCDENDAPIEFPALTIQLAADPAASEDDRRAWFTIGSTEGEATGFVGDISFNFDRGGESFLNGQLTDSNRDFALRAVGDVRYNTDLDPRRPRGRIALRLLLEVTFFIEPDTLFGTLEND